MLEDAPPSTGAPEGAAPAHRTGLRIAGLLALLFGLATLAEGGRVLFGGAEARASAGRVVPFVLHFNFAAGFAYLLAGAGALLGRGWALRLARALAAAHLLVLAALGAHVLAGRPHEVRTVAAMLLRTGFWAAQALLLGRWLRAAPR